MLQTTSVAQYTLLVRASATISVANCINQNESSSYQGQKLQRQALFLTMALMMEPAGIITENRALLGHDANNLQRDWIKCQASQSQPNSRHSQSDPFGPLRTQALARHICPSPKFQVSNRRRSAKFKQIAQTMHQQKSKIRKSTTTTKRNTIIKYKAIFDTTRATLEFCCCCCLVLWNLRRRY